MYLDDIPPAILERAASIRLVVFDVDGTLTDGRLLYSEDGREIKIFHVHDGLGLKRLKAQGIEVAMITARISHSVAIRGEELGIDYIYQGQKHKRQTFSELIQALELNPAQAAFVGDDLPDIPPMELAGLAIAVANAHPTVVEAAHWQTKLAGGHGAAREVSDLLLHAQGKT